MRTHVTCTLTIRLYLNLFMPVAATGTNDVTSLMRSQKQLPRCGQQKPAMAERQGVAKTCQCRAYSFCISKHSKGMQRARATPERPIGPIGPIVYEDKDIQGCKKSMLAANLHIGLDYIDYD